MAAQGSSRNVLEDRSISHVTSGAWQCHFDCIYCWGVSHQPAQVPEEGTKIPLLSGGVEGSRRACGMGDIVVAILGECICQHAVGQYSYISLVPLLPFHIRGLFRTFSSLRKPPGPSVLFCGPRWCSFCTDITEGIMRERPHAPPPPPLGPAPAQAAFPAGPMGGAPVSLPRGSPSRVHVHWTHPSCIRTQPPPPVSPPWVHSLGDNASSSFILKAKQNLNQTKKTTLSLPHHSCYPLPGQP